jgi:acyl-ACP thioesterase
VPAMTDTTTVEEECQEAGEVGQAHTGHMVDEVAMNMDEKWLLRQHSAAAWMVVEWMAEMVQWVQVQEWVEIHTEMTSTEDHEVAWEE